MMAVVANQTSLSFYTDAKLQKTVPLRRPVTDCTGRALIIGAPDVPRLGEITFFPRQVSVVEMQEISRNAFTFEALASGKLPSQLSAERTLVLLLSLCVGLVPSCQIYSATIFMSSFV
jgi:hypothetical protein